MRIALASLTFLFFTHVAVAATRLPESANGSEASKPPKELYSKGKGTIGLVSALVLGPIGWLGVRLLSRNRTQRKKAGQGMVIWAAVAVMTACILLIAMGFKGGGKPDLSNTNFNFGSSSSGKNKDNKASDIIQAPASAPKWGNSH